MSDSKNGRINYLDSAKGIGIILVCVGHAITNARASIDSDYSVLLQFISQFHMPLFFLLGGMVFSDKYVVNPIKSSWKKFKAYYIPFVVYNMIFVLLHNVMYEMYIFPDKYDIKMFIRTTVNVLTMHIQEICGAMWFLRCLLTIVLLFIWIRFISGKVAHGKYQEPITAIIVVALAVFSQTSVCPTFFKINLALYNMIFYYIGYLIRKYDFSRLIKKYKWILLVLGLGVNVCVAMRFTYAIGGYSGGYINILRFVVQIMGSIMILALVQWKPVSDSKLLIALGRKSLDIMALHFVCFKLVSLIIIKVYNLDMINMSTIPVVIGISGLWAVAYTIVGLSIPTGIRYIFDISKAKIKQRKNEGV